jgi:hypothetical protein
VVSGDQQLRRRHRRCVDGSRFHLGKSRERIAGTDNLNVFVRIQTSLFQHLSREKISGAAAERIDSEDFSTELIDALYVRFNDKVLVRPIDDDSHHLDWNTSAGGAR